MAEMRLAIAHDSLGSAGEGTHADWKGNKLGYGIVMDFFAQMAIEGRVYQVKAGTISVTETSDVPLADTAAEMCADCVLGTTIIPVYANYSASVQAGTVNEVAGKSVATVSSSGSAFVPLNLKSDGPPAASTARVDDEGGVTVTAELATTTPRHFSYSQPIVAGAYTTTYDWEPRTPPVLVGPRCFYIQVGATGVAAEYFAHFDYIELPTANIS